MLISRWFDNLTGPQRMVEDLTKSIAPRCEPAVWARIEALVQTMDPAQSRGYIRARAASVIEREVSLAVESLEEKSDSLVQRLTASVSDAVVRKMMASVASQLPAPQLRRAA